MNRTAIVCTLVALVLVIVAFLVTWFQIPDENRVWVDELDPPASLVGTGLGGEAVLQRVESSELRQRALIGFGAVAGIVILLGLSIAMVAQPRSRAEV